MFPRGSDGRVEAVARWSRRCPGAPDLRPPRFGTRGPFPPAGHRAYVVDAFDTRRPATNRGLPGASATGRRTDDPTAGDARRHGGTEPPVTSRITGQTAIRPGRRGRLHSSRIARSVHPRPYPGGAAVNAARLRRLPERVRVPAGRGGRCTRRIPRRSSSATMTRAASATSGSRVWVPASQSMYDGSKAAISPRVWPWNLPKSTSNTSASSSSGASRTTCPSRQPRSSGPGGLRRAQVAARTGSWRSGGCPVSGCGVPGGVVVELRGRAMWLVSTRPVTGRVGLSGGGPPPRRVDGAGRRRSADAATLRPSARG